MASLTRICLIGPESTGKSELAAKLAGCFGGALVEEFARRYAVERGNRLSYEDVEPIARGQMEAEDSAPRQGLLVLDTDLISTVVYSRHYYGRCPRWVEDEARRRRADFYLLMDTDVAWKPDPARDAGGEEREELFDLFRRVLDELEAEWAIVSGAEAQRFEMALTLLRERVGLSAS